MTNVPVPDILTTVKEALAIVPELHIDDWSMAYTDGLRTSRLTGRMLRDLVNRCEQAEAESEGRRVALLAKAEEATQEWKRAEQAEADLHALENKCVVSESAYTQQLAADLAALRQQRCETCQHRFVGMAPAGRPHYAYCKRTMTPIPELGTQTYATCEMLGNGCLAWARREP
jgi:hypothetical protein